MAKTLLITGGAGFIGSAFVQYQLSAHPEDRLVVVDSLTYAGCLSSLQPWLEQGAFRFVHADICDREAMERLFTEEKPDVVVHFAAESHVDRAIDAPEQFLQTNIMGTSVLLQCSRMTGVSRYHQVSTDEVYGDLPLDRPDLLFTESSPIRPSSAYSASKASADLLVMAWHRTWGLPATVSRCSNNYGPRQYPEKLIPFMMMRALKGEPLPLYGDGLNVRDWLYVEDHCRAIDLIIREGRVGEIYNIGGNCEMSNDAIVRMICRQTGAPESLITHVADRKGHDRRYAIDATRMKTELSWQPMTRFEEGMRSTIAWYMEHPEWGQAILDGSSRQENERLLKLVR